MDKIIGTLATFDITGMVNLIFRSHVGVFAQFHSLGDLPNSAGKVERKLKKEVDERIVVDVEGDEGGPIFVCPRDRVRQVKRFAYVHLATVVIWDKNGQL